MALYTLEAVVIRSRNLGEADKIVTFYSHERGKIRAVARGARRPRNRLRAGAEVFTHGQYLLFANQGLDTISQCEIITSHRQLREDLIKSAGGVYVLELFDVLTEEGEPRGDLFPFLLAILKALVYTDDMELTLRAAEVGLLARLGYLPQLEMCVNCGVAIGETASFSVSQRGVLCPACRPSDPDAFAVTGGTLATLNYLLRTPFDQTKRLRVPYAMRGELKAITVGCLRAELGRDVNSAAFLALVQDVGAL
ncbi:MAG: DNA repair protein RecO [bacterium]